MKTIHDDSSGTTSEVIRFAIGKCSLGRVLVASSERGVCAIFLGDDPAALKRDLEDRFPKACLVDGDRSYAEVVEQVVKLVEAPRHGLDVPLDVRGTAFQKRVWQALREIPAGKTQSYAEVAQRVGAASAVRAVAGACAANPLAVIIPCHRVVRSDGGLSGYYWSVDRKRALLASEAAAGQARKTQRKANASRVAGRLWQENGAGKRRTEARTVAP